MARLKGTCVEEGLVLRDDRVREKPARRDCLTILNDVLKCNTTARVHQKQKAQLRSLRLVAYGDTYTTLLQ